VKTGAPAYQEDVLQVAVKPLNMNVFIGQKWVSSKTQLLPTRPDDSGVAAGNVLAFISAEDWPSGDPDLKPLDYKLWAVLEDMAC